MVITMLHFGYMDELERKMISINRTDICRAITFHNHYIPLRDTKKESLRWAYLAFGAVDGIDVGADLFRNNKEKCSPMEIIWKDQKEFARGMRSACISHRIYAVYSGDAEKEKNFWETELQKSWIFTFFCRLQCCGSKKELYEKKEELEKLLNVKEELWACVYLTYDNSDLLVVLKSKRYSAGAAVINMLHNGINLSMEQELDCCLKSSFTIPAVHRQVWEIPNYIEKLQAEKLPKVYLKLIEKANGNLDKIIEELEKINVIHDGTYFKPILGADDQILELENIDIKDFLKLYTPERGILSRSNSILCENVANVTTVIVVDLQEELITRKIAFLHTSIEKRKEDNDWIEVYKCMIDSMYRKLENADTTCEYKELYTMLNVLPKFTGELFNDYLLFPLLSPIDNLIDILIGRSGQSIAERDLDKVHFYDFIKSFSVYVQSAGITDCYATQMMDFNEKIYDIPVKVNAFYNAYLYKVKSILNVKRNRYDLFIMPGMNSIVNVMELYPNHDLIDKEGVEKKTRLIKVEVPEESAYDIQNMMVILAHEVAHYVGGTELRGRKKRYEMFHESCAHIYTNYVWALLEDNSKTAIEHMNEKQWQEIEVRVLEMITVGAERRTEERYWEEILIPEAANFVQRMRHKEYKEKKQHACIVKTTVEQIFIDIGPNAVIGMFFPILVNLDTMDQDQLMEEILQITGRFTAKHVDGTTRTTVKTMIDSLMQIYEETFADVISVLLLKLDIKDYVNEIIDNFCTQGMTIEQLKESDIMIRISLVITMILNAPCSFANLSEQWENQLNNSKEDTLWYQISREALILWVECKNKEVQPQKEYEKNILYALRDIKILKNALVYLTECVETFEKMLGDDKNRQMQEIQELYKTFSKVSEQSVEQQIVKMVTFIEEYRKQLVKDWKDYVIK